MSHESDPQPDEKLADAPQEEPLDEEDQPETEVCKNCMAENDVVKLRTEQNNRCWKCGADFNEYSFFWRF